MTSLLDMYSKCSRIQDAHNMFVEMPERDIVAANTMISGLCRCNSTSKAIELFNQMDDRDSGTWNALISGLGGKKGMFFFEKMREGGGRVDVITSVSVLSICADLAALSYGRKVHGLVMKFGFNFDLPVGNSMVDMYAKCGCMDDSFRCFEQMGVKNVVSWTSLIAGFGKNGKGEDAVRAFYAMERAAEGVVPNKVTFLGVLYACSHGGLVKEGKEIFNKMVCKYSIMPIMEHYTCMVDLLGRAGSLSEAYSFIKEMPIKPDAKILTAFLSSCCSYMNVELAKTASDMLLELEPLEAGAYMLMSNFYGKIGDLESVVNVRRLMLNRGIRKEKANTWIEIDNEVHTFESGDKTHRLIREIYSYLEKLFEKMKNLGYVPNTSRIMQNVDNVRKEEIVLSHSEKLAIGFGLISTPQGTSLMIVKNLRMCVDCHVATALISKIEGREIVARDSSRFHHFKNGVCSCGNYW
ncbi:Pentatricopeptide repeat (PPR) superfamily protein [Euphorbia peplus]|nr:Pentatricopeptide repeat (PPR) superfamily protein [Euphorbia peplus]